MQIGSPHPLIPFTGTRHNSSTRAFCHPLAAPDLPEKPHASLPALYSAALAPGGSGCAGAYALNHPFLFSEKTGPSRGLLIDLYV